MSFRLLGDGSLRVARPGGADCYGRSSRAEGRQGFFVSFANPSTGESVFLYAYEQPPTAKLYAWPDRRMLNLSPVYDGPIKLKAGERLRLRYAVQVRGNTNM